MRVPIQPSTENETTSTAAKLIQSFFMNLAFQPGVPGHLKDKRGWIALDVTVVTEASTVPPSLILWGRRTHLSGRSTNGLFSAETGYREANNTPTPPRKGVTGAGFTTDSGHAPGA